MTQSTDPAGRLRAAADKARAEAAGLAKLPTPSLTGEAPDVDACAEHLNSMREMRIRYALAEWLDGEAGRWDPEAGIQTWDASHERALAVADAILGSQS